MKQTELEILLEQMAAAVVDAEGSNPHELDELARQFELLARQLEEEDLATLANRAGTCALSLAQGASQDPKGSIDDAALAEARDLICDIQDGVSGEVAKGTDEGGLELPSLVDDEILREFLEAQPLVLEEMERELLSFEKGDAAAIQSFKRRLHTMKGEAGVLGLSDLSLVCHRTEDAIAEREGDPGLIDLLLSVHDWIAMALGAYAESRRPDPRADTFVESLGASAPGAEEAKEKAAAEEREAAEEAAPEPQPAREGSSPAGAEATSSMASSDLGAPVERDEDTVELFAEFLQESAEGLALADEVLLVAERGEVKADSVDALFRVFHTIKGVSAFLELDAISELAHTTESLLNQVREGSRTLSGETLDRVFDSTSCMRHVLDSVSRAVQQSREIVDDPRVRELGADIKEMIARPAATPAGSKPAARQDRGSDAAPKALAKDPAKDPVQDPVQKPAQRPGSPEAGRRAEEAGLKVASTAQAAAPKHAPRLRETVKVDLERVDTLIEMIGELVIVEAMVNHHPDVAALHARGARNALGQLGKITRDLQDIGMRMRMVPVKGVFQKMARMVRDLGHKSGKQVRLVQRGESTEMDRNMVEQIADPLVHMIRNAVDHGVEDPAERSKASKDPVATITLSAYHEGGGIVIEVSDDGRGLDRDAILGKALEKGLVGPGDKLSDAEIHALIFAPGFSTAQQVTQISGRGVGMDVVRRNIEGLRGRVSIASAPGEGSTFKMVLPLTLAIIDGMLVSVGQEHYILPTLSIIESLKVDACGLHQPAGRGEMVQVRERLLPLYRLDSLLDVRGAQSDLEDALVVIIESGGRQIALLVDGVVAQQQVVIKSLTSGIYDTRYLSGAAILADGRVGLILNVDALASLANRRRGTTEHSSSAWLQPAPAGTEKGARA